MKLKKLLAAVTAAALAVTTMAVTSFTASAAAKDPVEITLYDSSTAPAGDDCGSGGKTYSVSSSQLSSWGVDADGLSSCYVIVTYAEAPTGGVIGINANNANGSVDWTANFSYVDNISGTTTSTVALSSVGDKAATVIANGLTVQVKSAYVSKIDFNTGSSSENIFTYSAGAVSEIEFNAVAMAALEGASGISAAITGTGNGYGYFQEMTSYECSTGGNPATLTSEDEKWDKFASASGIKLIMSDFTTVSKIVLTVTYPAAAKPTMTISPTTLTVAEGEDAVITITATNADDYIYEAESSDDAKATATVNGTTVTVKGKAAGTAEITVTGKKTGADDITAKCTVTVTEKVTPPAAETVEIAFPTDVIELEVAENEWDGQDPHGLMAKKEFMKEDSPLLGKTYSNLSNTTLKLTGVKFDNCSIEDVQKSDIKVRLFTSWTGYNWKDSGDFTLDSTDITFDLSTITGVDPTDELLQVGVQISINDGAKFDGLAVGDVVKINDDSITPPAGDKSFEGSATITCDNYWGQKDVTLAELIGDLDPEKTTIVFTGEFLNKIGYNSVSQEPAEDGSKWREISPTGGKITLDASDIVIDGFYFVICAGKESGNAEITWVATEKSGGSEEPKPPVTGSAIWEGNTDMGTAWTANVQIAANKFADIKADDTLKYTFTCEPDAQMKIASMAEGWPVIPGPNPDPEWGTINISGTSFSFVLTAADVTALKEYGMAVSGKNYTLTKVELVPKADPKPPVTDPDHTHTLGEWKSDATNHWKVCSECGEKVNEAAHTFNSEITTPATATTSGVRTYTCTVCGYKKTETIPATGSPFVPWYPSSGVTAPVVPTTGANGGSVPTVNGKSGWEAVSAELVTSSDGDKIVVSMNSATKVPSTILGDIEGKDVDLVLNMGRGITWTINGLSVTSRKTIDLDITKNTRHIPDEIVDKAEGSHKKQFSLDHKGNFGCTAALTYDVGTRYNGLYANLFYYNPKTEQLEFADCSLISGGNAKFMFTHASDYLITISDEPLGEFEDVSSAAGIASDNGVIGNGAAISAVLAVIVLGFGIVVYRKRRHN